MVERHTQKNRTFRGPWRLVEKPAKEAVTSISDNSSHSGARDHA
jgi:hypothetical protein